MSYPGPPEDSRLQRALRPLTRAITGLMFPPRCVACRLPFDEEAPRAEIRAWLCKTCASNVIPVEPPHCERCGEVFDGAFSAAFRCSNCDGRKFDFEFAIAGCLARLVARELIHRFKYSGHLHLRGALATLTLRALEDPRLAAEDLSHWLLVPVPLHATREADRAYNQSRELCQRLSALTGIPTADVLERTRATQAQAKLDRAERQKNLRGAFRVRPPGRWRQAVSVKGRSILLVDDVFTTGATTNECARVLRREGEAEKVVVITVARG